MNEIGIICSSDSTRKKERPLSDQVGSSRTLVPHRSQEQLWRRRRGPIGADIILSNADRPTAA